MLIHFLLTKILNIGSKNEQYISCEPETNLKDYCKSNIN